MSPPPSDFTPILLVVAATLIAPDGRVLVQQRPAGKQHGGLWEFPGGKVEPGETPDQALVRELAEELGIRVDPRAPTPLTFASAPAGERHLLLLLYRITRWHGEPRAIDAAALRWATLAEARALAMPPADAAFIAMLEQGAATFTPSSVPPG